MALDKILSQVMSSPLARGAAGGLLSSGLLAALTNKHGRKLLGGTAKLGAAAAVGALAVEALRRYQARASEPITTSPVLDTPPPTLNATQERVLLAMLSAVKADGAIDEVERARIAEHLAQEGITAARGERLLATLERTSDPHSIARLASDESSAVELYTASVLVMDPDHWAEQAYLRELAQALKLAPELVAEISSTIRNDAVTAQAAYAGQPHMNIGSLKS